MNTAGVRDFLLPLMLLPQAVALGVLLAVARPPHELFSAPVAPKKKPPVHQVELQEKEAEPPPPPPPLAGMADSLAPDAPAPGAGLASLTAGVVSGNGAGGGVAVAQGEVSAQALAQQSAQTSRKARAVQTTPPEYPSSAQARGISGYVILHVLVGPDGKLMESKVLEAVPPGVFEASALRAVRQWRFAAGLEDGKPAAMWIKQKVNFELE